MPSLGSNCKPNDSLMAVDLRYSLSLSKTGNWAQKL